MVRIGLMASPKSLLDRRELMARLGAAVILPIWPATGSAQVRAALELHAKPDVLALRPGTPETPVWSLGGTEMRFKRGDIVEIAFANELPQPVALNWRGLDGVPALESLTARAPLATVGRQGQFFAIRLCSEQLGRSRHKLLERPRDSPNLGAKRTAREAVLPKRFLTDETTIADKLTNSKPN